MLLELQQSLRLNNKKETRSESLFCLSDNQFVYQIHHYIESEDDEDSVNYVSSKDEGQDQRCCREDKECDPSYFEAWFGAFLEFHREHRNLAHKQK